VGAENFFLFGLTAQEVQARLTAGYRPRDHYETNPELREAIDLVRDGFFSNGDTQLFRPIVDHLLGADPYLLLADFEAYCQCQDQAGIAYRDRDHWTRMSILNTARSGPFSSDRTIREYSRELWRVPPVHIELIEQGAVPPALA
jgi:starch phosphorylase